MTPLNMTPAEAERWAYATGDTDRAALLQQWPQVTQRTADFSKTIAPNVMPHPPKDTTK